ncbi:hypothetical protein C7212DRAFT_340200 [Tuber magnatum]|uniref:Uncharacterized protein n=1 Tax=Tuber magnatum TaxID=42249 RepID=A0A317T0N0_9PEZI|nr:hypothetical protein C7212DRAFT_340200 [Tuber magnatum]
MKPLHEIAIGIRGRFFENYCKLIGKRSDDDGATIRLGNLMAHNGDLWTDIVLLKHGYLTDTGTFYDLYGIAIENAEQYTKSEIMIKMINKRATMLANPHRFFGQWDKNLQSDFDHVLCYFDKASTENWEQLGQDTEGSTPERQAWLRINWV